MIRYRNLLTAMSLLPKSNDWCRRYSSKFNSGWDIPAVVGVPVACEPGGCFLAAGWRSSSASPASSWLRERVCRCLGPARVTKHFLCVGQAPRDGAYAGHAVHAAIGRVKGDDLVVEKCIVLPLEGFLGFLKLRYGLYCQDMLLAPGPCLRH